MAALSEPSFRRLYRRLESVIRGSISDTSIRRPDIIAEVVIEGALLSAFYQCAGKRRAHLLNSVGFAVWRRMLKGSTGWPAAFLKPNTV